MRVEVFFAVLFWLFAGSLIYTWIIFPVLLAIIQKLSSVILPEKESMADDRLPFLSIIVAAYDEEKDIAHRIQNLLEQNYPEDGYEILVASDGSKDRTVEIAKAFEAKDPRVRVLDYKENRGKASVHNDTVQYAKGDILLFTDAGTWFEKDFLRQGVKWFSLPSYGCGSGNYSFKFRDDVGQSENLYWRMEKQLRLWEFKTNLLPFASGGCFFLLKKLFLPIPPHSDIDNLLTLSTLKNGYFLFYAEEAKAYDSTIESSASHYKKRVRTTLRSMGDMLSYLPLLVSAGKWRTLWVLFSHRLLRWGTGYFMLLTVIFNGFLVVFDSRLHYNIFFGLQCLFYLFVLLGWRLEATPGSKGFILKPMTICYSFFLANYASMVAIARLAQGKKIKVWTN